MARYVRLRYKFLPYLYQLFIAQEKTGEAILRPLFYDFQDRRAQPLGRIDDQFMVGPCLMHAPVVNEGKNKRSVVLPAGIRWYSLSEGRWHRGGQTIEIKTPEATTPLFVREGSLVALRPGQSGEQTTDLREIELHVFLEAGSRLEAVCDYSADDGETFGYQRGQRTTVKFRARLLRDGTLALNAGLVASGYGSLRVRVVSYSDAPNLSVPSNGDGKMRPLRPFSWQCSGSRLPVRISATFDI